VLQLKNVISNVFCILKNVNDLRGHTDVCGGTCGDRFLMGQIFGGSDVLHSCILMLKL